MRTRFETARPDKGSNFQRNKERHASIRAEERLHGHYASKCLSSTNLQLPEPKSEGKLSRISFQVLQATLHDRDELYSFWKPVRDLVASSAHKADQLEGGNWHFQYADSGFQPNGDTKVHHSEAKSLQKHKLKHQPERHQEKAVATLQKYLGLKELQRQDRKGKYFTREGARI